MAQKIRTVFYPAIADDRVPDLPQIYIDSRYKINVIHVCPGTEACFTTKPVWVEITDFIKYNMVIFTVLLSSYKFSSTYSDFFSVLHTQKVEVQSINSINGEPVK